MAAAAKSETAAVAAAIDSKSEALGFVGFLEKPIWNRAAAPLTVGKHPVNIKASSHSKWLYGVKGEMAVVHAKNIFDKKAGEWFNRVTKQMEPNLWGAIWSVDMYSGTFDQTSPWVWKGRVDSGIVTCEDHKDEYVPFKYDWLSKHGVAHMDAHATGPLWIFVVQNDDYDEGAHNIRFHLTHESKWFMEAKRPIFAVPLYYGGTKDTLSHQRVFELSGIEAVSDVYQNPAATAASTSAPVKEWVPVPPPINRPEREVKWHIRIYHDNDDYMEGEDEAAECSFTGTQSGAIRAAFDLNAEKCKGKQVLEVHSSRRGQSVDVIHARKHDLPAAMAAQVVPPTGEQQMADYTEAVIAERTVYAELLQKTDADTAKFVTDLIEEHPVRARYRRASELMETKAKMDGMLAAVTDQKTKEYARSIVTRPLKDPESDYSNVIEYLADPAKYMAKLAKAREAHAKLMASMGPGQAARFNQIDSLFERIKRNFDMI